MTAGALAVLHQVEADPATTVATAVVAGATAASTVLRFVAMRTWMFRAAVPTTTGASATASVQSDQSTEPLRMVSRR